MNFEERTLAFSCDDLWMYGILSLPKVAAPKGMLIVVGGPQSRTGSHRQFTLLARYLAAHGVPVLRFDCRGMGDSEGDAKTFEDFEDDLRCAIDAFLEEIPSLKELVIWGLCDAASAALFYAYRDRRVTGLVLLNPWVRTDEGAAKVYLKHYYITRLFDTQLWSKIWHGRFNYSEAIQSLLKTIGTTVQGGKRNAATVKDKRDNRSCDLAPLPERMLDGLSRFNGKLLLIISGDDFTAKEFSDVVGGSRKWQELLASPQVSQRVLPEANHTFSRREWRDQVAVWTDEWIQSW